MDFKFVGTQNMRVLKSVDNEISNFVGTQNWWQLQDVDILEMLLHKV